MKIENSVILITGGASGIGEYMARYYSEKGGIVYICDLQEEKGKSLEKESNSKIKFFKCDITNDDSVKQLFELIKKEQGRIDIVINSAGVAPAELIATPKSVHSNDLYKKILEINTFGSFLVSKYAAKMMIDNFDAKKDCNGVIIFVASIAAYEGQKGQVAYAASKGALVGMTLPMARDLGRYKIRVNSIAPGIIETPLIKGFHETKVGKSILDSTPLKQVGKPQHVCETSEFIISCDHLNGTTIRIDGGSRLPLF